MANQYFTAFANGLPGAGYDLDTATIKVVMVRNYTFDASHATMAAIYAAGATANGAAQTLVNPVLSGGVFDADDTTFTTTYNTSPHTLVLFQASAVTGGADLPTSGQKPIAHYDSGDGLPAYPGTGTLKITWNNGLTKIIKVG